MKQFDVIEFDPGMNEYKVSRTFESFENALDFCTNICVIFREIECEAMPSGNRYLHVSGGDLFGIFRSFWIRAT